MRRVPDLARAARMAYKVLAAKRISTLPVDPLTLLRACRDTAVYTTADAADILDMKAADLERLLSASDAVTFVQHAAGRMRCIVLYRPGGNPARLRFTLAHELGHRVLGHCAREASDEREADCFASHLLCPEPVLAQLVEQRGALTPEAVAVECYVSPACAKAALRRTRVSQPDEAYLWLEAQLKREIDEIGSPKGE